MRAAALAVAALTACSAAPVPADLSRAYERQAAGDLDGALAAYRAAARRCDRALSSERTDADCARALLGEAGVLADAGRTAEAIAAYAAIGARTHDDPPPSAEGLFRAGRLAFDAGRAGQAAGYLWAAVEQYPDEAFAADALAFVVARARADAPLALWQRLDADHAQLADTDVADNLLWWMAELAEHELAQPATARALYARIPVEHPTSGLRDDARWRVAALATAAGDYPGAAAALRGLLATREVAFGAGSYFSVWLDDAQLALARLLRDHLADPDGAARAFARLPRDYPASILVDDALDELAALEEARGHTAAACQAAARQLRHDDASRFAPAARDRLARLGCPETGR